MKLVLIVALCVALCYSVDVPQREARHCVGECQTPAPDSIMNKVMPIKIEEHDKCVAAGKCPIKIPSSGPIDCVDGFAGEYPCNNTDLLSFIDLNDLGSTGDGNDIWGWTDPETNKEYAFVCVEDGTSFVDVTNPTAPLVVGFLPTHTVHSIWRDAKVFNNTLYIVSEARNHGMQIFNLTRLRELTGVAPGEKVPKLTSDGHYDEFGSTHNLVINEESGYAYAVGTKTCRGGLHMVRLFGEGAPEFAGCYADDGYTHDAQCVNYSGPDTRFQQSEICFCYNEDTLTIVDVTDKDKPNMLSRQSYLLVKYTHQGWLNKDQTHLLLNDELDERDGPVKRTRSMVWNVTSLTEPKLIDSFYSRERAIDHNLYLTDDGYAYESNYCAGLRVLDVEHMDVGLLEEVAFFDVAPDCNEPVFSGSWSAYPYFPSGTVVVSSIERGLFVVKVNLPERQ